MKKVIVKSLILFNIIIMNAQEYKPRDEKFPIQLSDEYTLYQKIKNIEDKNILIWELYLKKGERLSLLDKQEVKRNNIRKALPFIDKAIEQEINDITMLIPNLIDAYKEKQSIFVFLYKDRSAMLQNYTFNEEKKTFKIKEYPLIAIGGGSVMNFGGYNMGVQKIILDDDVAFAEVAASRQVLGGGGLKFLMIEKGEVRELKFKDNYKTVRFKSPISSFEKEYLSKEIKNQFVKHKLLKEKDRFVYYGYLKDNLAANVRGDGNIYLFYKDENNPLSYQVIKYDISTKEWLINGYQKWRVHSTEDKGW